MAPEQLRGQEVDHRADQFALGVVLYELLTGEIPQGVIKPPHALRRTVPPAMSQAVMKSLEARPESRHADMAALGKALESRSGSGLLTRTAVAIAVAVLLAAFATFVVWRSATESTKADPHLANAPAEAEFRQQLAQLEELKKEAEAVAGKIESEAKQSPGAAAEQVAELWQRHPTRKEWLPQAEKLLASATGLAQKRSFDQALADLKAAEAEYHKPQAWWQNARQAMASINKTRAAIQKQVDQFPPESAGPLLTWPDTLVGNVQEKLLEADGTPGPDEARRLASLLPRIEKLFTLRKATLDAAHAAQECATRRISGKI